MKSPNQLLTRSNVVVATLITLTLGISPAVGQETIIQEWDFTGGSLLSESGTNATFFGNQVETPDDGTDDQYLVTRANGFSGSVPLGTALDALNTDLLTVSVTLSDFDFSIGNDQWFGVRFRSGTANISDLRFDAQTAAQSGTIDRMRLTGTAVAGIALDATASTEPITYGMTLNFVDNSYTYWIGTPASDASTWVQRFDGNYTGFLDLSSVTIDGLQWAIQNHQVGESFNMDQIKVFTSVIPEPSTFALTGLGALGLALLRRRR
jgi:hypothetical protein